MNDAAALLTATQKKMHAFNLSTVHQKGGALHNAMDLLQILVKTNADPQKLRSAISMLNRNQHLLVERDKQSDDPSRDSLNKLSKMIGSTMNWLVEREHRKYTKAKMGLINEEEENEDSRENSDQEERISKNGRRFSAWKFVCPHCGRKFSTKGNARGHLLSHSDDIDERLPYKCDSCDMRFAWQNSLQNHKKTHLPTHKKKHMKCKICGKSYSPDAFAYHKTTHLDETDPQQAALKRRHKCELCEDRFRNASNLKRHMSIHTGVYPYKCELCPKGFNTRGELRMHVESHEKGTIKKFKARTKPCSLCPRSFKKDVELTMHLKRHEDGTVGDSTDEDDEAIKGKKMCQCILCSAKFANRGSVYQHIKRVHPDHKFADGARFIVIKPGNKCVKAKVRKSKK